MKQKWNREFFNNAWLNKLLSDLFNRKGVHNNFLWSFAVLPSSIVYFGNVFSPLHFISNIKKNLFFHFFLCMKFNFPIGFSTWLNFTEVWEHCWLVQGREMILSFLIFWILALQLLAKSCKMEFTRNERVRREMRGRCCCHLEMISIESHM